MKIVLFIISGTLLVALVTFLILPIKQWAILKKHLGVNKVQDTIVIQPFVGMPPSQVQFFYNELRKSCTLLTLKSPIELPVAAYYAPRKRYRADTLIAWLSRKANPHTIIIGLTKQDISTNKDKIPDWGVMGLGYQPGNSCVVSTYRLHKNTLLSQLYKVSIHELGHTYGLPHCKEKDCYMRDAEGQNNLDDQTTFCPSCKKIIRNNGWL